jgi:DNA-binding NarL/FixJ family response regulator
LSADIAQAPDINSLTVKETLIINLLKIGLSSREIADRLQVSGAAIGSYRYQILKKLQLKKTSFLINFIHIHDSPL